MKQDEKLNKRRLECQRLISKGLETYGVEMIIEQFFKALTPSDYSYFWDELRFNLIGTGYGLHSDGDIVLPEINNLNQREKLTEFLAGEIYTTYNEQVKCDLFF